MSDSVQVVIRVRPINQYELMENNKSCITTNENTIQVHQSQQDIKVYQFDQILNKHTTQEQVFSLIGNPIIFDFIDGYNVSLFAYGQTGFLAFILGAGKTFTMQGSKDDGLQQRIINQLFTEFDKQNLKVAISFNYYEIYNESFFDLLSDSPDKQIYIREDINKGVFLDNIITQKAQNTESILKAIKKATQKRHVSSHKQNMESSRSHSVLTIHLENFILNNDVTIKKSSKIHFIDLAGSERQKKTQTQGDTLKEASKINKSLTVLGTVINSLVDKKKHIPYRDSKLTFILKDSLGGNSKTYMIANISESSSCLSETISTLKFAQRAKMILNQALKNEECLGTVQNLKDEIKKLKFIIENQGMPKNNYIIDHSIYQQIIESNIKQFDKVNNSVMAYQKIINEYRNIYDILYSIIQTTSVEKIKQIFQQNNQKYEEQKELLRNKYQAVNQDYQLNTYQNMKLIIQNQEILQQMNNEDEEENLNIQNELKIQQNNYQLRQQIEENQFINNKTINEKDDKIKELEAQNKNNEKEIQLQKQKIQELLREKKEDDDRLKIQNNYLKIKNDQINNDLQQQIELKQQLQNKIIIYENNIQSQQQKSKNKTRNQKKIDINKENYSNNTIEAYLFNKKIKM